MSKTWRLGLAGLLAAIAFCLALSGAHRQGIARDEVVYIQAGVKYADFWVALMRGQGSVRERDVTATFGGPGPTDNNREHPALMKTLFGFSQRLFHDRLQWLDSVTAARLPTAMVHALGIACLFLLGAEFWGVGIGLLSALFLLLLPRGLFHAGLATFDAPVAALWLVTLYAYLAALKKPWMALALAVCYGLTLATKHNALMLPLVILPHWAFVSARHGWTTAKGMQRWKRALAYRPWILPAMLVGGPLVLWSTWPWLWHHPLRHGFEWVQFHLRHVHYNFEYLGANWNAPPFPWHVAWATTFFVVPTVTAFAAVFGVFYAWRARQKTDEARAPLLLFIGSMLVAMGAFMFGSAPIFGAEKHWAAAMPTLALFAAIGVVSAGRAAACLIATRFGLDKVKLQRLVVSALSLLTLAACGLETFRAMPYGLSYYSASAGGPLGGADLGMNRQFWGYAAKGVLAYVSRYAPKPGAKPVRVYSHDAQPAWDVYRKLGLLPEGMPDAGREEAGIYRSDIALVIHEKHFNRHDYLVWNDYKTVQPAFVLTFAGVPLVSVYVRSMTASARPGVPKWDHEDGANHGEQNHAGRPR